MAKTLKSQLYPVNVQKEGVVYKRRYSVLIVIWKMQIRMICYFIIIQLALANGKPDNMKFCRKQESVNF